MAEPLKSIERATGVESAASAATLPSLRLELARARLLARAWAGTVIESRRPDMAALFARHALVAYAARKAPTVELSPPFAAPFGKMDHAAEQLAATIGHDAAGLPMLEALHVITSLYATLLPDHHRGALGAFYTPPALCSRLLDQAEEAGLDWGTAKVLDPASGGGAFLLHAASRMRQNLASSDPRIALVQIGRRLLGLEVDPHSAGLAQGALEVLLADLTTSARTACPKLVRVCDTLEEAPRATFDLVVGNPPYGRVALTETQRQRYKRSLYGHANLYGVFTDIALRWAKPGGLIAYLTPTSFLAGHYYSALRGLLARAAPPVAIDFVHARSGVFEDVLQETLLAVYRKGAKAGRAQIHYLNVSDDLEAQVTRNGTVALPTAPSGPWLAPRTPDDSPLIAVAELMAGRLADLGYSVSTGPLVWNRFKSQLRNKAQGRDVHPLIWAEAVTSDGRFIFRAEKKNHAPYFKLEQGDAWLLVDRPCVLVQRTTAKEQARRLIAAELPPEFIEKSGGVVVENHLNMVRSDGQPEVPSAVIAALLNSAVVDQLFRCMSGSVAVSAFELEALPLPMPSSLKKLGRLVAARASVSAIEGECRRLYGVTQ